MVHVFLRTISVAIMLVGCNTLVPPPPNGPLPVNRPPEIRSITILTSPAVQGEIVQIEVVAVDPDGNLQAVELEYWLNDEFIEHELLPEGDDTYLFEFVAFNLAIRVEARDREGMEVWEEFDLLPIGVPTEPPFSGTIFIDPDIITPADPTTFQVIVPAGRGLRTMFDRRVDDWITVNAYLFDTTFDDGFMVEVQVNPEFGSTSAAFEQAEKYAIVIGRLPTELRRDVETVWIHMGTEPFGGGNNNLLIHTGQAADYLNRGILEEVFVHEGAHSSLDAAHAAAPGWLAAQEADPTFISNYAGKFPDREDIAESFLTYLAIRYRADRISPELEQTILAAIPNRIEYFDGLDLDMFPLE